MVGHPVVATMRWPLLADGAPRRKHQMTGRLDKQAHHDAVLANLLDEGVACTVVRNSQTKGRAVLLHLHGGVVALDVRKQEVVEADLAAKQPRHVHLVRVQGAVQNLHRDKGRGRGVRHEVWKDVSTPNNLKVR